MTTLRLEYDGLWAEADLDADPMPWARSLVLNRWQEEGLPPDEARAEELAEALAKVLIVLGSEDPPPVLVMLLYPQADEAVVTVVTLRYQELRSAVSLEDVAEELRLPVEMLEQPAEEELLETPSGPALRIVQRHLSPVEPEVEQVQEHVAYLWVFDDGEGASVVVSLSSAFEDLVESGDWRPALDELARGLALDAPPRA